MDWKANRTYNTIGGELASTWKFPLQISNYIPSLDKFVFSTSVIIWVNNMHFLIHADNQDSKD